MLEDKATHPLVLLLLVDTGAARRAGRLTVDSSGLDTSLILVGYEWNLHQDGLRLVAVRVQIEDH